MKPAVGIFAHPDDEAFGPGGTLAMLSKERDVYLICVTDGSAGLNSSNKSDALNEIRKQELLESAKVLGVKQVFFLPFKDGTLSNNLYHEIAVGIEELVKQIEPEIVITFEPRGVSGHLDHIAVSFITTYVVKHMSFIREIWQYCTTDEKDASIDDYFVYFPKGYKDSDIDKKVDISTVWNTKVEAMQCHQSQKHDIERVLNHPREQLIIENFLIIKRENL